MKHLKIYILLFIVLVLFISLFFLLKKENNLFTAGISKEISFYGTEKYRDLLGYSSFFPETILDDFHIESVSLGITLTKEVTKNKYESLKQTMIEAITDNNAFDALSDYMPYRDSSAFYRCGSDQRMIVIITLPIAKYEIDHIKKKLTEFSYTFSEEKTGTDSPYKQSLIINNVAYIITGDLMSQDEAQKIVDTIKFR